MTEYQNNSAVQAVPQDTPALATGASQVHLYSMLATHLYGLETIKVWAPSQSALQAVNQEFNAYVLLKPSPEGTGSLAFWKVSVFASTSKVIFIC